MIFECTLDNAAYIFIIYIPSVSGVYKTQPCFDCVFLVALLIIMYIHIYKYNDRFARFFQMKSQYMCDIFTVAHVFTACVQYVCHSQCSFDHLENLCFFFQLYLLYTCVVSWLLSVARRRVILVNIARSENISKKKYCIKRKFYINKAYQSSLTFC